MGSRNGFPARLLGAIQAAITVACALAAFVAGGRAAAMAAVFGGLVVFVPGLYFAARSRLRPGEAGAKDALGAVYRAEVGKLALTVVFFVVGALVFGQHYAALMLTTVACLAANWIVLAMAGSE